MHGTLSTTPTWWPDWTGEVCAIIGAGPSADVRIVNQLQGRCRVIVVNRSYELAPWADALYAADEKFWVQYPQARQFAGMKITRDVNSVKIFGLLQVDLIEEEAGASVISVAQKGLISRGGNSGFQAVNLAVQFGATRLIWIGLDFSGEHWHGRHPATMVNPRPNSLERWAVTLDKQADVLARLGVEVLNCSAKSVLKNYQFATIEEVRERWLGATVA